MRSTAYYHGSSASSSAVSCPSPAPTFSSRSSMGWFALGSSWCSAFFADGASVALKFYTVFLVSSSSNASVPSDTSTTLHGPSLGGISSLYDSVTSRSVTEVVNGGRSIQTHCLAVSDSGALQTFRSWSSLYRRCNEFIRIYSSCRTVVPHGKRLLLKACGDVVAVMSVGKAVGLPKGLVSKGCRNKMKLSGAKLVDRRTWELYAKANDWTYMYQSLCCSAT